VKFYLLYFLGGCVGTIFLARVQNVSRARLVSYPSHTGGSSSVSEVTGHEPDYFTSFIANIEWSFSFVIPVRLLGSQRNNFTIYLVHLSLDESVFPSHVKVKRK
jgi:hypothetical protein